MAKWLRNAIAVLRPSWNITTAPLPMNFVLGVMSRRKDTTFPLVNMLHLVIESGCCLSI